MSKKETKVLFSWIGHTDLTCMEKNLSDDKGPIAQAIIQLEYDHIVLLSNYKKEVSNQYLDWLSLQTNSNIFFHFIKLSSPIDFGDIYKAVTTQVDAAIKKYGKQLQLTFHLSPGTSAMAAVWILLAKTRYSAELIESSKKHGTNTANVPFDISAEFIPDLIQKADDRITQLGANDYTTGNAFEAIIHRSDVMKRVIGKAQKIAPRTLPVLIEGESGTGKELLARSIHNASLRKDKPFIAVNCGAISKELAESEFFGHVKGAFTGAHSNRQGYFKSAHNGTLFLDEIGELPLELQVKLLRTLQEKEVIPVGSSKPKKINVRIVAATNRNLIHEVGKGNFREDLFYRIAVAVIQLPPLRERSGDLSLLTDHLIKNINKESALEPNWKHKKISTNARNLMLQYHWSGNIRELKNTLIRASIWSNSEKIDAEDIKDAILETPMSKNDTDGIFDLDLSKGIDLQKIINKITYHYLCKAMEKAGGNKTRAAELLGLKSYQTMNNWLEKFKPK